MRLRACYRRPFRGLTRALLACLGLCALTPVSAFAQRELHWDALEVAAHLDSAGALEVIETHTMVFTGDWNGGERRFNIRPRQKLSLTGVYRRGSSGWEALTEDSQLNDVDDYAWTDAQTLRWRSRRTSDPPFANSVLQYELRYVLSGILFKEDDQYRLDHDFAFPDRAGAIQRFVLRLTFDPAWRPISDVRPLYSAGPLAPGTSFVLTIPFRYEGTGVPIAIDSARPPEIVAGVWILLGATTLAVMWFFKREQSYGRFAPLQKPVDESWLREHILKYPAEVVAAAWDENIGRPEVVALIARMVNEGTLESTVGDGKGDDASMTLGLKVGRSTLHGYERTLVDALFFNGRTETSTKAVKAHYRTKGFDPAKAIQQALEAAVESVLPPGPSPRRLRAINATLFLVGAGLVLIGWFQGYLAALPLLLVMVTLAGVGWLAGARFRTVLDWGRLAAVVCLTPGLIIAIGTAAYLWFRAGTGEIELLPITVVGLVAIALALTLSSINALKSRRHRGAIAFRKTLAAGRAHFIAELSKERPALRDEWYPWLLAFELGKQMDDWSAQQSVEHSSRTSGLSTSVATTSNSESGSDRWTGFGGGRSGGAGAGASWQAAASGMAASVSPPSSSGSSGGSSSSSSGSSSGGSSGGGGGGGW